MKSRQTAVAAGVVAAALALTPAALGGNHTVQIAGQLVAPSDVSAAQVRAGTPEASRLAQIGGRFVRPENISATERQLSSTTVASSATSAGESWWKVGGISVAALAFALLVGATLINRRSVRIAGA